MGAPLKISDHAIARFRERTGAQYSETKVRNKIEKLIAAGKEARPTRHYGVIALLNHGLRPARYVMSGEFLFVIEGDEVKTVHHGEAKRWEIIH